MDPTILLASWRLTWRNGFAPQLSTAALEALRVALANDSPELLQGATTSPLPIQAVQDWPVEAACAVCFGSWKAEHLETVEQVESRFAQLCNDADKLLGEPAACRYFLNWFDATPRQEMRQEFLPEITREINRRSPPTPRAA